MFEPSERFAEGDLAETVSKTQKAAAAEAGVAPTGGGEKMVAVTPAPSSQDLA
jgi:hypothetical protein